MKLVGATRATMPSRSSSWTCGSSTSSTAVQRREHARFAPATAALGGRLTAEWAKDLLERSLNRMLERRRLWTTANPAAHATDAMDLCECPIAVEPAKRLPDRRGVNRGIIEWSRLGHAVEQFYA